MKSFGKDKWLICLKVPVSFFQLRAFSIRCMIIRYWLVLTDHHWATLLKGLKRLEIERATHDWKIKEEKNQGENKSFKG